MRDTTVRKRGPKQGTPIAAALSRVGVTTRSGDAEGNRLARIELATEKMAAYVRRTMSEVGPLTPEQRARVIEAVCTAPSAGAA